MALTLVALFGERVLRGQVEQALGRALGRPVTLGALSVNLAAREVELRDLLIPGLPASKRPSLVAPRVKAGLSFRSLLTTRIQFRSLDFENARFSIQVFPDGSTDLPGADAASSKPSGVGSGRRISIGKLAVRGGELALNEQRVPLEFDLPRFEAAVAGDAANRITGDLRAGPGSLRFGTLPALRSGVSVGFRFADSVLHLDRGALTAGASNLAFSGDVDVRGAPRGTLRLSGPFDLESFERSMSGSALALKGVAQTQGTVTIANGRATLKAALSGEKGAYDSIPVTAFSTNLAWDGDLLRLTDLDLAALGGRARLELGVPDRGPVTVRGTLASLSAEPLLAWLFEMGPAGLGARVTGPIDLSFPESGSRLMSGRGTLDLVADATQGDPLSGRVPFTAENGVVTLTQARLEAPRTIVTLDGTLDARDRLNMAVKLQSEDLATTDVLGVRLRAAIGTADPQALMATGRGTAVGRATGPLDAPVFTGRFDGDGVGYLGVTWGEIDWRGAVSPVELRSDALIASRGLSRIDLSGSQRLGATGVDDAMDLEVRIRGWSASDLLRVIESDLDIDTAVTGTLRLLGTRAAPLGFGNLASDGGRASGLAYTKGDLRMRFEGAVTRIENLTAEIGGGDFALKGLVVSDPSGVTAFDGDVEVREVELADLGLQDPESPAIGGHVSGRAILGGPIERPRVAAHFESKRLFYGDEGIGAVTLDLNGTGDGSLRVTGRSDSPRFTADIDGTIGAKAPHPSRIDVKLGNMRVDPVLRALGSRFQNAVAITASASARIEGPLLEPEAITAQVRDTRLRIAVPEYAIEAAPGFVIDIEKNEARIAGLTLTGEGTSLSVSGRMALKPDDENNLAIAGRADLRVLSGFLREWRVRGAATLRSQIAGTPRAMRVSGGLDIEDGSLRLRTFPQGLDGLNGRLVFNETQARVAGLEGRFGGGRVSVTGQIGFGGSVPASFDMSFTGASLGLRYPEGLRSTFGASLRLQGTAESHWLTGNLLVSKAQWTRKYVITSELLSSEAATGFKRASLSLKPSPMHLDISIKAPGTLRLDNNLASLAAKADLSLTGSPTEPQLLGRMEIERGKVFFRGNTYEVRKGVAQFSNPREINPVFDIEADTRMRSYRLTLQANGTLDRVSTRITSDPPLTAPQIASLLTGGDETDVANLAGTSTDIKTLGSRGVNSFASSWLDDNLTGKVAQGFGLSRLSIDPGKGLLSRTGSRLTVGKRVARDLEVVYSRTIFGGTESQLATAEYSLTNRFSLVLSWAEPGGVAADVRTRFVLGR